MKKKHIWDTLWDKSKGPYL